MSDQIDGLVRALACAIAEEHAADTALQKAQQVAAEARERTLAARHQLRRYTEHTLLSKNFGEVDAASEEAA